MIESGNRPLAEKYIKVICSTFAVSENWFLTGKGEMFTANPYQQELTDILSKLAPPTQRYLIKKGKELLKTEEELLNLNPEDT